MKNRKTVYKIYEGLVLMGLMYSIYRADLTSVILHLGVWSLFCFGGFDEKK